ncbi:TetR/AcrR family transcriptional regulator [Rhodoplanes sp. Z2-YC6860]|uniref:TetR/AcrR family transcriptional regulator n=1 Tax=Rhodoplanes sp. Z2-YC6860 TaxID=674703 RepID=UPI00078E2083|nr:TetR/AcrR family transcriptional regulator [Rhodoplanes sp. Z2-YC6860]AMN40045.1 transcriptional regulator, TetR family [Rhodoplanes sp. Z2-YC6860]
MNAQVLNSSKTRLLDAALTVIRTQGYAATTVDDICHAAGVTKGSFFHHFKSKDELALAAADHFSQMADGIFSNAPYQAASDPAQRVLGYIDFRAAMLARQIPEYTCLLGTMVQEAYMTHPAIREACDRHISAHAGEVAKDIAEAKRLYAPKAKWSPESLAFYTQAVLQGAFILAKAKQDSKVAAESVAHLRDHIETLLTPTTKTK